jgi:Zn-finger nucleic acid-binding protein
MNCPVCKEVKLIISDRNGIEIDYCPDCRGVWLDRGELDKIIDRAEGQKPPQKFNDRDQRYYESDKDFSHDRKWKKRGGFLSELFD